jgi:uncharacterized protein Yka (UPF0111/DUF47 family)
VNIGPAPGPHGYGRGTAHLPASDRRVEILRLLEEAGPERAPSAALLRDLLADYAARAPLAEELVDCENEDDRLSRDAIASLLVAGIDPMVVIRWKDIVESLEASIDACEHVAHVLEGITLKRPR